METKISKTSGMLGVMLQLLLIGHIGYFIMQNLHSELNVVMFILPVLELILFFILFGGYVTIAPNEAVLFTLFGKYKGSIIENGWFFTNPFISGTVVDLKLKSHQTDTLEVNEKSGIPIHISAMINYQIKDTYNALFAVDDWGVFALNQFEVSLRKFASKHTYNDLGSSRR